MLKSTILLRAISATLLLIIVSACSVKSTAQVNRSAIYGQCSTSKMVSLHCGKTPSVIFDNDARLWVVFEHLDHLYVSFSNNFGKTFSSAKRVNLEPEGIYTNGENRPKIQLGLNGEIYLSWTKKTAGPFTGDIRFSRSVDSGNTFSNPITINDDGLITGHRFDSMVVTKDGSIFLSWIDKRDNQKSNESHANSMGKAMKQNGAIYTSFSTDSGQSFSRNQKLANSSCVCCRIAMTPTSDNSVAISWRHVYPGSIRDHAFAIIDTKGIRQQPVRVSKDNWKIEACPHHGPAITEDKNRKLHLVWFTASDTRKGIFYGRLNAKNNNVDNLVNLSKSPTASHPYIVENEGVLHTVWKEFDGEMTQIKQATSLDLGRRWSAPLVVAQTKGNSDHPFILTQNSQTWLSWLTDYEGLELINLESGADGI